jgi:hypothetical protein
LSTVKRYKQQQQPQQNTKLNFDKYIAVLPMVVDKVAVGISVNDLCQFGDDLIEFSVSIYRTRRKIL